MCVSISAHMCLLSHSHWSPTLARHSVAARSSLVGSVHAMQSGALTSAVLPNSSAKCWIYLFLMFLLQALCPSCIPCIRLCHAVPIILQPDRLTGIPFVSDVPRSLFFFQWNSCQPSQWRRLAPWLLSHLMRVTLWSVKPKATHNQCECNSAQGTSATITVHNFHSPLGDFTGLYTVLMAYMSYMIHAISYLLCPQLGSWLVS